MEFKTVAFKTVAFKTVAFKTVDDRTVRATVLLLVWAWTLLIASPIVGQIADDGRVRLAFDPDGGGEPVILSFAGEIFEEGRVLPLDADPQTLPPEFGEAERYLLEIFRTNRDGTPNEIVDLWRPEEREDVGMSVRNPSLFERNRSVIRRITRLVEHGRVEYGRHVLIAVHQELDAGDGVFQLYILARQDGRYYQTSGLSSDAVYSVLLNIFREKFGV